jgi:hypothetical protein
MQVDSTNGFVDLVYYNYTSSVYSSNYPTLPNPFYVLAGLRTENNAISHIFVQPDTSSTPTYVHPALPTHKLMGIKLSGSFTCATTTDSTMKPMVLPIITFLFDDNTSTTAYLSYRYATVSIEVGSSSEQSFLAPAGQVITGFETASLYNSTTLTSSFVFSNITTAVPSTSSTTAAAPAVDQTPNNNQLIPGTNSNTLNNNNNNNTHPPYVNNNNNGNSKGSRSKWRSFFATILLLSSGALLYRWYRNSKNEEKPKHKTESKQTNVHKGTKKEKENN